jgi:hypothetical protein
MPNTIATRPSTPLNGWILATLAAPDDCAAALDDAGVALPVAEVGALVRTAEDAPDVALALPLPGPELVTPVTRATEHTISIPTFMSP